MTNPTLKLPPLFHSSNNAAQKSGDSGKFTTLIKYKSKTYSLELCGNGRWQLTERHSMVSVKGKNATEILTKGNPC